MAYDPTVPLNLRTSWVLGLAGAGALLLHLVQVLLFGHDLIGAINGHGLEILPGLVLAPSPVMLATLLTLASGVALLVVRLTHAMGAAPRTRFTAGRGLELPESNVVVAAQTSGERPLGRAPPSLLT